MGSFGKYHGARCVIDRVTTYKPTIAYMTTQVSPAGTQPAYQPAGIPLAGPAYARCPHIQPRGSPSPCDAGSPTLTRGLVRARAGRPMRGCRSRVRSLCTPAATWCAPPARGPGAGYPP